MVYRFRDFVVDSAKGCLLRGGEEVPLRRKAFQVLVALLQHPDQVVSKEELFTAVWPDTAVTDDVLAGVIAELRKALQDNPKSPVFIKTVPRVGYRFLEFSAPPEISVPPAPLPAAPPPAKTTRVWLTTAVVAIALGGSLLIQQTLGRMGPADEELQEVAWWRFDEPSGNKAVDSSGHGVNGTVFGQVSRAPGRLGTALSMDGQTVYVEGRDASGVLPSGDASRTVTAWFRSNTTNGDLTHFFVHGEDVSSLTYRALPKFNISMRMDGRLAQGVDNNDFGLDSPSRFDDSRWHQVAAVWKGRPSIGESHLYVDGREEASRKLVPLATPPRSRWWIGGLPHGTLFRGQIDDVRVFNGALSGAQAGALYRCSSGSTDLEVAGQPYYFLPIHSGADFLSAGEHTIRNMGADFGGVQFAKAQNHCALGDLWGADMGQDLRISVDLQVPSDAAGHTTEGGPYLRSRLAAPGDGIIGGTSAGYWVVLFSSGNVSVQRLNPSAVVAFAEIPDFDSKIFHHMEVAAVGERMQVKVDGNLIRFDQGGRQTSEISIPPLWNGPPQTGYDRGAAGIAFSSRQNRSLIGGQIAKAIRVERATALLAK